MKPKGLTSVFVLIIMLFSGFSFADDEPVVKKVYNNTEISKIAEKYVNNNLKINNPAVVDVDNDGVFDILNFTDEGNVEFYKNVGTIEEPEFALEDKNYGDVGIYSALFTGMPVPVFFADKDGDEDLDVFAVLDSKFDATTNTTQYKVSSAENSMDLDHYTLITIILVLLIVVLLIAIL